MAKQTLRFRYHNPNTAEATAEYLLKLFILANQSKLEEAIKAETEEKRLLKA